MTNANETAQQQTLTNSILNDDGAKPQLSSSLVAVIAYLSDLLSHLLKNQEQTDFKLLLIANDNITTTLKTLINQTLIANKFATYEVTIEYVTPDTFLQLPYHTRYNLGCLLNISTDANTASVPNDLTQPESNTVVDNLSITKSTTLLTSSHGSDVQNSLNNTIFISTRLRDLFADQCVVILDKTCSDKTNLRSLGYTQAKITEQQHIPPLSSTLLHNDTMTVYPNIVIWQFNLYDYKPEPDWLNARYWANPENFGKYRW